MHRTTNHEPLKNYIHKIKVENLEILRQSSSVDSFNNHLAPYPKIDEIWTHRYDDEKRNIRIVKLFDKGRNQVLIREMESEMDFQSLRGMMTQMLSLYTLRSQYKPIIVDEV